MRLGWLKRVKWDQLLCGGNGGAWSLGRSCLNSCASLGGVHMADRGGGQRYGGSKKIRPKEKGGLRRQSPVAAVRVTRCNRGRKRNCRPLPKHIIRRTGDSGGPEPQGGQGSIGGKASNDGYSVGNRHQD
jgi:hypothetical protein